jgi:GTP-binding protein EngB required for normal cell division
MAEPEHDPARDGLNDNHERRLTATAQYVDKLLAEIEAVLSRAQSPFGRYVDDVAPTQKKVVIDFVARIRNDMLRALTAQGIDLGPPRLSAVHSIRTGLQFVDSSIEELKPHYMRGYGQVSPSAAAALNGIVEELQGTVRKLDRFLAQGLAGDITTRLDRLGRIGSEIDTLRLLGTLIERHGLVGLRSPLAVILERLEDPRFEIAVFGRVSTGKSSLLNHLLETTALPVGVTPITAVPTRVQYGDAPVVRVWTALRAPESVGLDRLGEFATEHGNPGNARHVTRLVVEMPSVILRNGVVFVDTPGLGSLMSTGASETLAYLPRCDLAVVLIDASSTVLPEDIATLRRLYDAGTPALVLLSKSDLLSTADLDRATAYVHAAIQAEVGIAIPVNPVSVVGSHVRLLERWQEEEIVPRLDRHRELVRESIRRKIGALREAVHASLEAKLTRGRPVRIAGSVQEVEDGLRLLVGRFEAARLACEAVTDQVSRLAPQVVQSAAKYLAGTASRGGREAVAAGLAEVTTQQAVAVHGELESLRGRVLEGLRHAAGIVNLPETFGETSSGDVLRELPSAELAPIPDFAAPRSARLLGQRLGHRRIEAEVRRRSGAAIEEALSSYGRVLEDWSRRGLTRLRAAFDADADAYRAVLDRAAGPGGDSPSDSAALEADLAMLALTAA